MISTRLAKYKGRRSAARPHSQTIASYLLAMRLSNFHLGSAGELGLPAERLEARGRSLAMTKRRQFNRVLPGRVDLFRLVEVKLACHWRVHQGYLTRVSDSLVQEA